MANESCSLEKTSEVAEKLSGNVSTHTDIGNCNDVLENNRKDFENVWAGALDITPIQDTKSEFLTYPECKNSLPVNYGQADAQNACSRLPLQTIHPEDNVIKGTERQKGRASLIRLQAVQPKDSTVEANQCPVDSVKSATENVSTASLDACHKQETYQLAEAENISQWNSDSSNKSSMDKVPLSATHYSSPPEEDSESTGPAGMLNSEDVSDSHVIQRFLTADGQFVYGYKDSNGEFNFFYPPVSDRESHNEKERKRRSRVSDACGALRRLVPGVSEKTDKASVFEQAARYVKFLRDKYGTQYDQIYYEKYFLEG